MGLLLASVWAWRLSSDLDDPGDADLLPAAAPALAVDDNAYVGLADAIAAAAQADPEWLTRTPGSAPEGWDAARLTSAEGAQVFARTREALSRPALRFPAAGVEDEVSTQLSALARVLDTRSRLYAERRELAEAFDDALLIIQLGERLATGEGVALVPALVGARVQELGYARVRSLLEVPEVDAPRLRAWIAAMGDRPIGADARRRVWAGEYASFKALFRAGLREQRGEVPSWMGSVHAGYFFQENRTLAKIAQGYRRLRDAADTCGEGLEAPDADMRALDYVRPNAVGEILARVAAPDFGGYIEQFCALEVRRQATRSVMALRAYRLEHGRDAAELGVLVPAFLDTLPIDPFDGQALRYSRDAKRVWSVGRDGVDAGGDSEDREGLDEIAVPTELSRDVAAIRS